MKASNEFEISSLMLIRLDSFQRFGVLIALLDLMLSDENRLINIPTQNDIDEIN